MYSNYLKIERLKKINKLIKYKNTGNPINFAIKLNVSRRQMYNILDELISLGAIIQYSKISETYYYENDFDLEINFSVKIIRKDSTEIIYGGQNINEGLLWILK